MVVSSSGAKRSAAVMKIDHGQRRSFVVSELLASIFRGQIKAGERLIIQDLATRFEVSPTPIREALVQLAGIGIIDFVPNCGGVVRAMTARDVREICQVRRALECEATRAACGKIDRGALRDLAERFRKISRTKRHGRDFVEKSRELDSRLHDLIANQCGNRFLASELERLKLLFRAFRDASWDERIAGRDYDRCTEEASEHLEIVEALLEEDSKRASRAMSSHIRSAVKYWNRGLPS